MIECDLLIIGGGPAGLSTAINGASEGLKVCLLDSGSMLGGQARESNAIENYPGFSFITGDDLMTRLVSQAHKFDTVIHAPLNAAKMEPYDNRVCVTTEDYQQFTSRSVVLSLGLNYRRLAAKNVGRLMGKGVYYGLPSFISCMGCNVIVVGGANSAGQAALHLAKSASSVVLLTRSPLEKSMSTYLIDRIIATPNIDVVEGTVSEVLGADRLEWVHINGTRYDATYLFIYIGAMPRTLWLDGIVKMCPRKYIYTGHHAGNDLPFSTSLSGVFAAGDVRYGSTKRIAAAIGEGSAALSMVHQYLNNQES